MGIAIFSRSAAANLGGAEGGGAGPGLGEAGAGDAWLASLAGTACEPELLGSAPFARACEKLRSKRRMIGDLMAKFCVSQFRT
jgi:hypothetical protein